MKPDVYGHCCLCHENLLVPRIVGGKEIMTFTPKFDQTEFVISNKSRMVVCMCKDCKEKKDLSDSNIHDEVMKSVIEGWELKPEMAPLDFDKFSILFHSEGIDDYVINNRLSALGK